MSTISRKKARATAKRIVDERLDNATQYTGIGHSVITVEAAVELVADVLSGRVK